tara:strand:+ start:4610 stop:4723 length:114 start_codon:yes stop_codon:yes gene_type:complete
LLDAAIAPAPALAARLHGSRLAGRMKNTSRAVIVDES